MKKKLTQDQEFQVMKLVLDKFLWIGFLIMAVGMYKLYVGGLAALQDSILLFVVGTIVLILFMVIIVKEFEIIK